MSLHVFKLLWVFCGYVLWLQVRGVSGGEKKRVTTAEMLVGNQRFMAMDEISTGELTAGRAW
jgi:energy-coupling factor transporter ATP-binding protein EcfA2